MMVIVRQHSVHACTLYWGEGRGVWLQVFIALWPWHWRQIWLHTDVADNVNITRMRHGRMLGLRYGAMLGALLPCRGRIVFHDTSFVSILISDTDLIIRRAQMESVIGGNINRGLLDWSQECRQWQYWDYIGTFVCTSQVTIIQILHLRQLVMCREISLWKAFL